MNVLKKMAYHFIDSRMAYNFTRKTNYQPMHREPLVK